MRARASGCGQPWDAEQAESEIVQRVRRDFAPDDQDVVVESLFSILLEHTTMSSEANLHAVRLAVAELADGDPVRVRELADSARLDFRNVLFWLETRRNGGVVPPRPWHRTSSATEDPS